MTYTVTLKNREVIARNTFAIWLSKPDGFDFTPGQYVLLTTPILNSSEKKSEWRYLSIASSPLENELMFAVRGGESAFKQSLISIPLGTELLIEGPSGPFILPDQGDAPLILIAGGIGIAPFMSMLRHTAITKKKYPSVSLFYSNRTSEDAAFLIDLEGFKKNIFNYRFTPTITQSDNNWNGLRGRISRSLIIQKVPEFTQSFCYIAGSQPMVVDMEAILLNLNIPKDHIRTEKFCGYAGYLCNRCREKYATATSLNQTF